MKTKQILEPSTEHPITSAALGRRTTVRAGGQLIADSANALLLREAAYPPVIYIPRADVRM